MGCALMGGSAGGLLGMAVFHHKTRKPLFRFALPLGLCAQAALLVWAALRGAGLNNYIM